MGWDIPLAMLLALVMDRLLGEPRRFHPLVGLGYLAKAIEARLNRDHPVFGGRRLMGGYALILVVVPVVVITALATVAVASSTAVSIVFGACVLYIVIGARSLAEHAQAVKDALDNDDLPLARTRVGYIVSRETGELDEVRVTKATMESVLENGSDAIFAPLFWFVVLGPIGAVAYRAINTLDAMWGYRNDRFISFGWAAARLDDVVNWVPARLCALTYALVAKKGKGYGRQGLQSWRRQAPDCESPNAGPVMACGAGALNVELGGDAIYHGQRHYRPTLGQGAAPEPADIDRSLELLFRGIALWVVVTGLVAVLLNGNLL